MATGLYFLVLGYLALGIGMVSSFALVSRQSEEATQSDFARHTEERDADQ